MRGLVRRVLALFDGRTRRRLGLAVAGSLVVAMAEALAVVAVLPLMDLITSTGTSASLDWISGLLGHPDRPHLAAYVATLVCAGFLLKGVAAIAIRWWTTGFLLRQGISTSSRLLRYYLDAPYALHLQRSSADLLRTLNDAVGQVYSQVVIGGMAVLTEGITIIVLGITLLVVNPLPTIAIAVYFGVAALALSRFVRRRSRKAGEDLIHGAYVTTRTALHALGGIKEIKLRHLQGLFVDRYATARGLSARAMRSQMLLTELPRYAIELLFVVGVALMTVMAYAGSSPSRALGTIALFAVAGFRLMPSLVRLMSSLTLIRGGLHSLALVEADLTAAAHTRSGDEVAGPRLPFRSAITVDEVSFRYADSAVDVLREISVTIPVGTSLGLVGSSGAGKSTFVDLLLGFHAPTTGTIRVDGVDIHSDLAGWQRNLAMVPQEVYLLDESLRDNIRFAPDADDPDDRRLRRAIEEARLTDLVRELPLGVDAHVGERGSRISGGQRQRVGIARALFREPALLVLDEATSALDNETERQVTETMDSLRGQVTVVVVAHRLSTVKGCDQIAFLSGGRVADVGSFEELRTRNPEFARLVALGSLTTTATGT